jgi:hypothetical protein
MFAFSRSRSFRRTRLRQNVPNHDGNNRLALNTFNVFGADAGLQ